MNTGLRPVTIWRIWNEKEKRFDTNHIEDGHVEVDATHPIPRFPSQSGWLKAKWEKQYGMMDENGKVITNG